MVLEDKKYTKKLSHVSVSVLVDFNRSGRLIKETLSDRKLTVQRSPSFSAVILNATAG